MSDFRNQAAIPAAQDAICVKIVPPKSQKELESNALQLFLISTFSSLLLNNLVPHRQFLHDFLKQLRIMATQITNKMS